MPSFPQDMDKARALDRKQRKARELAKAAIAKSEADDAAAIRAFANELRAKAGLPPLRADEPVVGFFCRRGRK